MPRGGCSIGHLSQVTAVSGNICSFIHIECPENSPVTAVLGNICSFIHIECPENNEIAMLKILTQLIISRHRKDEFLTQSIVIGFIQSTAIEIEIMHASVELCQSSIHINNHTGLQP